MVEYPIELPLDMKDILMNTPCGTKLVCPDCGEEIIFETRPPEEDYTHCSTLMIRWV